MSKQLSVEIKSKQYIDAPTVVALGSVEFTVRPEELVTILGPSGSGKSTVLRLIAGLDTTYQGEIRIGEHAESGPSSECGIVFQEPRLFPWFTVHKNVSYGVVRDGVLDSVSDARVNELLELMDLTDFAESYPIQLSGGMAQRVALARALVTLPQVLLLDEPFAALDELTRMRLQDELQNILKQKKTTTLLVTHNIEEAIYLSDRIFLMSKRPGKLLKEYAVGIAKPRSRSSEEFIRLRNRILSDMREMNLL